MKVTYIREKNKYVTGSGRIATVADYGYNFNKCEHNFVDQHVGERAYTIVNGKEVPAILYQCSKCFVYMVGSK